jgi:acetyl-CoA carboxylase carboxyltransferase component
VESGGVEATKVNGQLSARDRINYLLDDNSFVEIGAFVTHRTTDFNMSEKETPSDGVVTGYGIIDGSLVYVYSQDSSVLKGAIGEMHAKKICNIYNMAMKMGAPVIALIDSAGLRLQESTDALNAFGEIFLKQTLASGVIPQITALFGVCGGGTTFIPALSDFTFMTAKNAKLFVNSPNALDSKSASFETVASAKFHSEKSGMVDVVSETDEEVLSKIKELVLLLPACNDDDSSYEECQDDLNRVSLNLNDMNISDSDVLAVIAEIADNNSFYELKENYGKEIVTAFVKLNGVTVGVVANQKERLTTKACIKAAKFVGFCNAFNISLLTITNVVGFETTVLEEETVAKAASKLLYSFANATIPKVNLIIGKAYGTAYVSMNSKHIGADFVYAWPTASIGMMDSEAAVRIMYADEIKESTNADKVIATKTSEYENNQASPFAAASRGYIDDIIEPAASRKRIIAAFEMLFTKREDRPNKKHGTV